MKKILLYSTLALGVGLCSCSQEDLGESPAQAVGQPVTVSVQLPGEVGNDGLSRAVPSIPADHKLRCILYVSGNGETPVRQEKVLADTGGTISFTFTPATDTYTCSFWADFVSGTDTNADGRYDDLYYDTQRIPDVTYSSTLADGHSFYNNDACDAFTGHFTAAEVTGGTVVLKRPFAKVNFKEKTSEVSGNIAVTGYAVNNGMNITDGTVSETRANLPDYSGAVAGDGVWFCNYLFADGTSTRLPESISMTVGDGGATSISTDGLLALNANTQYNLSFEANVGEVVPAPQVGDYFFTDGTWASSLDENKNVAGVVFAVKGDGTGSAIENDVIGNYSDANGATDVLAWVVAAKDAGSGKKFYTGRATNLPSGLGTDGANDITGYANTGLWYAQSNTEYEAVATAKAYDVIITGETPNSNWYLPAAGQLMALVNVYAENNSNDQGNALAVKKSLQLIESEQTDGTALMGSGYYWTSSGSMSNESVAAYRVGFHETEYYGKNGINTNLTSGSYVRPVLTIFKSAN